MRFMLLPNALFAAALVFASSHAGAITFDDGQLHVIDAANSYPFEEVVVDDGPGGAATTLDIVQGGQIGTEGIAGGLESLGDSIVNMSGGTISGGNVLLRNQSVFSLSDGLIGSTGALAAFDESKVYLSGGAAHNNIIAHEQAEMTVIGGLWGFDSQSSVAADGSSSVAIEGGTFPNQVRASEDSVVLISGGSLESTIFAFDNSAVTVVGSAFNYPFGPIGDSSGTLTGTLSDGSPLNVPFARASTATIELVCPGIGFVPPSTPSLAADQDNYCEGWSGVSQPANDLSRAGLELVDLSLANLSGALLIDADLTDADLSGADLIAADLTGAILEGSLYDEFTLFPSGNDIYSGDWGLPGDAAPWDLDMIPVPEPASGLMLAVGGLALAAAGRRR